MQARTTQLALLILVAFALSGVATAGKGNGKGKPGGGEDPPASADPEIVYFAEGGPGEFPLMIMDADGGNQTTLISDASSPVSGLYGVNPTWSPDGSRIAFHGAMDGDGLWVVDADGTDASRIVVGGAYQAAWSPAATADGNEKIAYIKGGDVWVANPDGTEAQNLTKSPDRSEHYPTWSADASRLAFWSRELGTNSDGTRYVKTSEIRYYVLVEETDPDLPGPLKDESTTVVIKVTANPLTAGFAYLEWARSGGQFVFSREDPVSEKADLWTIDIDKGTLSQVTFTDNVDEWSSCWSPDDSLIVFQREGYKKEAKNSGIYVIKPGGSELISLDAGTGMAPDWLR